MLLDASEIVAIVALRHEPVVGWVKLTNATFYATGVPWSAVAFDALCSCDGGLHPPCEAVASLATANEIL